MLEGEQIENPSAWLVLVTFRRAIDESRSASRLGVVEGEDMGSFSKYVGGSPTNIACGTARLGLRSALITGVGDEHMGRFIVEQLKREGVDTRGVKVDAERLTALVLLGIRDDTHFPLIFYRQDCADMGLSENDIDESFIAEARAVLATGTHLSHALTEAAVGGAGDSDGRIAGEGERGEKEQSWKDGATHGRIPGL